MKNEILPALRRGVPKMMEVYEALACTPEELYEFFKDPMEPRRLRRPMEERKLNRYLRSVILGSLPLYHKPRSVDYYISASIKYLRSSIDAQLQGRLSWETFGKDWSLGHRVDQSHFNLTELVQFRMAWHESNLIPLKDGSKAPKMNRDAIFLKMNRLYNDVRMQDGINLGSRTPFEEWEKPRREDLKPRWAYHTPMKF